MPGFTFVKVKGPNVERSVPYTGKPAGIGLGNNPMKITPWKGRFASIVPSTFLTLLPINIDSSDQLRKSFKEYKYSLVRERDFRNWDGDMPTCSVNRDVKVPKLCCPISKLTSRIVKSVCINKSFAFCSFK